jgi:hypothetical protein
MARLASVFVFVAALACPSSMVVGTARAQDADDARSTAAVCGAEPPDACLALIARSIPTASKIARAQLYLAAAVLLLDAGDARAAAQLVRWSLAVRETPSARAFLASLGDRAAPTDVRDLPDRPLVLRGGVIVPAPPPETPRGRVRARSPRASRGAAPDPRPTP